MDTCVDNPKCHVQDLDRYTSSDLLKMQCTLHHDLSDIDLDIDL
jgi:hypothetical protein